jgi:AbrB family looped-hinge helix DNA binding protein
MTTLKLHYDGWLALPAGLREKLGLKSGDRLEAELVGGTLVLRPAATARGRAGPGSKASAPPAAVPAPSPVEAATPGKRKPGRPRKVQPAEAGADRVSGLPEDAPPAKRKPGRPRKVRLAEEPGPAAAPASEAGEPWKLRRKTELPAAEADEPALAPARRPERVAFDTGYEREERHPFRQVEVRKLDGPGRGHNRARQKALG